MQKSSKKRRLQPAQEQARQPGKESLMVPQPEYIHPAYKASGRLQGRAAVITGGDSGIGRAVSAAFAKEGCDVAVVYFNEHKDARLTKQLVEDSGQKCIIIPADVSKESECRRAVERAKKAFGRLDVLVNNAAVQFPRDSITKITKSQLEKTFKTNIFSYFYMAKFCLKHFREGSVIINTASVTAYRGSANLIDYSSTKGAIVSFTRSLSASLAKDKIRVNGVAPGPVWTPLIPASFPADHVASFGSDVPLERAGQPGEIAPCYVFLASEDSGYMSGQILHPNGGEIVNG